MIARHGEFVSIGKIVGPGKKRLEVSRRRPMPCHVAGKDDNISWWHGHIGVASMNIAEAHDAQVGIRVAHGRRQIPDVVGEDDGVRRGDRRHVW
jgi:hypothetical protein